MSVHAVHAAAERNVCYIVVSTETPPNHYQSISNAAPLVQTYPCHTQSPHPKTPQHLAQPFAQMRYRCEYQVSSTGLNILEVYIIYLHVYMSQYMRFCRLSHVPRLRLACAFFKVSLELSLLAHAKYGCR